MRIPLPAVTCPVFSPAVAAARTRAHRPAAAAAESTVEYNWVGNPEEDDTSFNRSPDE